MFSHIDNFAPEEKNRIGGGAVHWREQLGASETEETFSPAPLSLPPDQWR